MEIKAQLLDKRTGKTRMLNMIFDTGAYMTVIDTKTLIRAGYNVNKMGRDTEFSVVGREKVPAKEILLRGLELGGISDEYISLGPVLVYATDMSDANTSAVLGLNVIREFETKIKFGEHTFIELTPTFDIAKQIECEDFIRTESRFGIWSQGQVESRHQ